MSSQLQETLNMFVFLAIELSALFIGISLLVGILQRHIPPSKVEALLSSNRKRGYFLAAALGSITPFCSCSTIPMLKGLIRAKAGFGPMMVFLFSSPLLNPIIVVLFVATFGLTLTAIYVLSAFLVSLGAGWLLQILGFERYVRHEETSGCGVSGSSCNVKPVISNNRESMAAPCCSATQMTTQSTGCCDSQTTQAARPKSKYSGLWQEAWADFKNVLPYLFIGIAIGSVIYGYIPTSLLEKYAGSDNPFAIPVAAVIGVPLYLRAEALIPLSAALMTKGVSAGAILALIIGSAGASLTELILLRSLFTFKLLAAFVAVILTMAMIAGYVALLFF
ncbi:putative two-component membrane permease complex subunit [Xenorhabdus beddingii]|uniref:Putative two-component membrane permease complex subunit n=1 Tax=Xenorhabdus beddingii TaxID=40578 RepID=A0A1Y2STA8_9GAMM|nr:permease [Xenorhabdus beddingii]OTA21607.1 putative two-component membrane permease complex subunit [Xenorhabdus beddingii]